MTLAQFEATFPGEQACKSYLHKVSAKYTPLYVAEFQFRYNNPQNPDIFGAAIAGR